MLGTFARGALRLNRMKTKSVLENVDMDELRSNEANERTNNFSKQMSDNMKKRNRTLYSEERNVGNKEIIEDRQGLKNAYASPSGLYSVNKTLYISGTTGKDGSVTRDILDDLIHLPTRNAEETEKYKDVMNYLKNNPQITRLVSHSLGSAVANTQRKFS